jgi:heme-degrading monooxygenase HmoA
MYAVLIEVDVSGVGRVEGLKGLREQIVPAIKGLPGFRSGTWLTGNEAGLALSLTVWDAQEHAEAMANSFGPGSSPQANATVRRCEVREVAATG